MKKIKPTKDDLTPSSNDYTGETADSFDLINKYGTYEIQPTCDTDEDYPQIAQGGVNRKEEKHIKIEKHPK